MTTACFVASDLTWARAVAGEHDAAWRAADGPQPMGVRQRAQGAAQFFIEFARRHNARIGPLVVGVEGAACRWIAAPSTDPRVVTAAVRRRAAEWGQSTADVSVQALAAPVEPQNRPFARGKSAGDAPKRTGAHMATLEVHDAPLRLCLDALDRMGARPAAVMTLWHAMAQAWKTDAAPDALLAVVMRSDPEHIEWAWGVGEALLAAGDVSDAPPSEHDANDERTDSEKTATQEAAGARIAGRITLDWLTWAAELGAEPARILVLAPDADELGRALASRWPDVMIDLQVAPDPLADTLRRLGEQPGGQEALADPRHRLVAASRRAGSVHRRLLRVASLATALLALGVAGLGWRTHQIAESRREQAAQLVRQNRQIVLDAAPELLGDARNLLPNLVRQLDSVLATLRESAQGFEEPGPPRPIYNELEAFLRTLASVEGARLIWVNLDESQPRAQVDTQDFAPGEALLARLRQLTGRVRWTGSHVGNAPRLRWSVNGEWEPLP